MSMEPLDDYDWANLEVRELRQLMQQLTDLLGIDALGGAKGLTLRKREVTPE